MIAMCAHPPGLRSTILSTQVQGLVLVKAWTLHWAALRSQSHSQMVDTCHLISPAPFSSPVQHYLNCAASVEGRGLFLTTANWKLDRMISALGFHIWFCFPWKLCFGWVCYCQDVLADQMESHTPEWLEGFTTFPDPFLGDFGKGSRALIPWGLKWSYKYFFHEIVNKVRWGNREDYVVLWAVLLGVESRTLCMSGTFSVPEP